MPLTDQYDGLGNDITGDLRIDLLNLPLEPYNSTAGDQFIGIYFGRGYQ